MTEALRFAIVPALSFVAAASLVRVVLALGGRWSGIAPRTDTLLHRYFPWSAWTGQTGALVLALALPAPTGLLLALLFDAGGVTVLLASFGGVGLGVRLARRHEEGLRRKFDEQLPGGAVRLADAMRAGLTLPIALDRVANDSQVPLRSVLASAMRAYRLRMTLSEALADAQQRAGSREFALLTEALITCEERGGRLPTVLDRISVSLQELRRLREKVEGATSGAILSMRVMIATPFFMLFFLWQADPASIEVLFTSVAGWIVLALCGLAVFVAGRWARSVLTQYV